MSINKQDWKQLNSIYVKNGSSLNIVGTYAEQAVAAAYGAKVNANPSQKGYDLLMPNGERVQIKATRQSKYPTLAHNTSDIHNFSFDSLICVVFDANGDLAKAVKITVQDAQNLAYTCQGRFVIPLAKLINFSGAQNITAIIKPFV